MRIHIDSVEAGKWIAMAVFHLRRVAGQATRSGVKHLSRVIHVNASTKIRIDFRHSLAQSVARITSGIRLLGFLVNHSDLPVFFLWNPDGSTTEVTLGGGDGDDFMEGLSKNGKLAFLEEAGFFYDTVSLNESTSVFSTQHMRVDGLSAVRTANLTVDTRLFLRTVLTDDEGLKTMSAETYDFAEQQVFIDEAAILGASVYSLSIIKAFLVPNDAVSYQLNNVVTPDYVFHKDHSVLTHKSYANSWFVAYSGSVGTPPNQDLYSVFTIQEKDVYVIHSRDSDTGVASEKLRLEFSKTRDYGSVLRHGTISYEMTNPSVYRVGSEIVQSKHGNNQISVYKSPNAEDISLVLTLEVLTAPPSEVYNPAPSAGYFEYAGSPNVTTAKVSVRSRVYMYVEGVLTHTLVFPDYLREILWLSSNRTDVGFLPQIHWTLPLRKGTDPTFFVEMDLANISVDTEAWYISGEYSEKIDVDIYSIGTGTIYSGSYPFVLSLDGQFNFRVRADELTVDVYRHGLLLTDEVEEDTHKLIATLSLSNLPQSSIWASRVDSKVLYSTGAQPSPAAVSEIIEHRLLFTSNIVAGSELGTWSVRTTSLVLPEGFSFFESREYFDLLPPRSSRVKY